MMPSQEKGYRFSQMTTNTQSIHSALATWSGFVYQGKVALFHALTLINNPLKDTTCYQLQLDSLEDFAIMQDERIYSLHQVKAKGSQLYSTYKAEFDKLNRKARDASCTENAYFHLARKNKKSADDIKLIHPFVKIYEYPNGNHHSDLHEIDALVETEIGSYLSKRPQINNKNTKKLIRAKLEEMISNHVSDVHHRNHEDGGAINFLAFEQRIPFSKLTEILERNWSEWLVSREYFCHLLKTDVDNYFQAYLYELEEQNKIMPIETREKLGQHIKAILDMKADDMVKFVRQLMPHRKGGFDDISDYNSLSFSSNEFKESFLYSLHEIKTGVIHENSVFFWSNSGEFFIPTAINSTKRNKKNICIQIIENIKDSDLQVAFEEQNLVTADIDAPCIVEEVNAFRKIEEDTQHYKRITRWKKVALLSVDTAKGKIDENDSY